MAKYTIEMTYLTTMQVVVNANHEGEALDKARDIAEEADINEFSLGEEREAQIVSVND